MHPAMRSVIGKNAVQHGFVILALCGVDLTTHARAVHKEPLKNVGAVHIPVSQHVRRDAIDAIRATGTRRCRVIHAEIAHRIRVASGNLPG